MQGNLVQWTHQGLWHKCLHKSEPGALPATKLQGRPLWWRWAKRWYRKGWI